jgi:hypothetical protein
MVQQRSFSPTFRPFQLDSMTVKTCRPFSCHWGGGFAVDSGQAGFAQHSRKTSVCSRRCGLATTAPLADVQIPDILCHEIGGGMFSLLVLVTTILLTMTVYFWRRSSGTHSRSGSIFLTCLCCLDLGLALRFGGRTYPGVYFHDSLLLNSLLNDNNLFVGIGYTAVVVGWAAASLHILIRPSLQGFGTALIATKWLAFALAATIAIYGFSWAVTMQHLP